MHLHPLRASSCDHDGLQQTRRQHMGGGSSDFVLCIARVSSRRRPRLLPGPCVPAGPRVCQALSRCGTAVAAAPSCLCRLPRFPISSEAAVQRDSPRAGRRPMRPVLGTPWLRSVQPGGTAVETAPPRLCPLAPSLVPPQVARLQTGVDWWADPQGVPRTVTDAQNDGLTQLPKPLGWRDDRHGVFTPGPSASKRTIVCLDSMPAGGDKNSMRQASPIGATKQF